MTWETFGYIVGCLLVGGFVGWIQYLASSEGH